MADVHLAAHGARRPEITARLRHNEFRPRRPMQNAQKYGAVEVAAAAASPKKLGRKVAIALAALSLAGLTLSLAPKTAGGLMTNLMMGNEAQQTSDARRNKRKPAAASCAETNPKFKDLRAAYPPSTEAAAMSYLKKVWGPVWGPACGVTRLLGSRQGTRTAYQVRSGELRYSTASAAFRCPICKRRAASLKTALSSSTRTAGLTIVPSVFTGSLKRRRAGTRLGTRAPPRRPSYLRLTWTMRITNSIG